MSNGQDLNTIVAHTVYEAKWEAWKDVAPSAAAMTRPGEGIASNNVDRVLQFLAKGVGHTDARAAYQS
jgi:hypothetical protein